MKAPSGDQLDLVTGGQAWWGLRGPRFNGTAGFAWRALDGKAAGIFAAIGVLAAQDLHAQLGVPIGIVQVCAACAGGAHGSHVRAFVSPPGGQVILCLSGAGARQSPAGASPCCCR